MVAMAPGTVTVVQQVNVITSLTQNSATGFNKTLTLSCGQKLQVGDEQEIDNCGEQLMVVNEDGDLTGDQVMVVEDEHGLEALTVLTQGENTHHYIVYVQEHTVEIN